MNFDRKQAKELSTDKELELFDSARPPLLNKHTISELKRLVKRSRTLRDKLKDVKRGQIRSSNARSTQRGTQAADRSADKANLYAEVHDVFTARLEKIETDNANKLEKAKAAKAKEAEKAKAAKAKAQNAKKTLASTGSGSNRSAKKTTASKAAQNTDLSDIGSPQAAARKPTPRAKIIETRIAKGGQPKKNAHISSQNKRNQGKRDSKKG